MYFLVISDPMLSKPEEFRNIRQEFRTWVKDLEIRKKVVAFYPKTARGSVMIFDVLNNDELHKLMTKWLEIVPANFDVIPLVSPSLP